MALARGKRGLQSREEIKSTWDKITTRLHGRKSSVVFTGMAGVGKTVLLDYLSGAAYQSGYAPPGRSEAVEKKQIAAPKRRINALVVPGQQSSTRLASLNDIFVGKKPVNGVVHVVSNGYVTLREQTARQFDVTLEEFLALQRQKELEDLDETCERIRQNFAQHRRPLWLLVAVTKLDLFYHRIEEAAGRYTPDGDSPFANRLRHLQSQVGSDNLRWATLPACAWLEHFNWRAEQQKSQLLPDQRDHYLAMLTGQIARFCEA